MAIFEDKESKKRIQYLEEERKKIWSRIVAIETENKSLKSQISASSSESAKDAVASSKKAAEFKNKTEQRLNEANQKVGELNAKLDEANRALETISSVNDAVIVIKAKADQTDLKYDENYQILNDKIEKLTEFMDEHPDLDDKLTEVVEFVSDVESNVNKSKTGLATINSRRKEIEEFHKELFGYDDTDEVGDAIRIEGL